MATNVYMRISLERARVAELKYVTWKKKALKSVAVIKSQELKSVQLCNDSNVTVLEKHQEEL